MRKLVAGLAVAGLGAAALAPLLPRSAAAAFCSQPSVSGISVQPPGSGQSLQQQHGPAGSLLTLTGSGFTSVGCSTSVSIGGANVSTSSVSSGTITLRTPSGGASGPLTVTLTDSGGGTNRDSHLNYITDPTGNSLDNSSPNAGQTVQFVGTGFQFNLANGQQPSYGAQYHWNNGAGCPALPGAAPSFSDASHIAIPMPGQYCDGYVILSLSTPAGTSGGTIVLPSLTAPFNIAPHVNGFSGPATAGQSETVDGSGFGSAAGSVSVSNTPADVSSWSDGAVTFTIPAGAPSGNVTLVRPYDNRSFSAGTLGVTASITGLSPAKAAVGDSVTVSGAGFGSQGGSVSVGSTSATVSSWSPAAITFTVPTGATTGAVNVSTNGSTSSPSGGPTLNVIPKITGITPSHAAAGSLIEVDGTTFGTQQGTATVGGQSAQVTLWGDKSVLLSLPSGLPSGGTTVTLAPPGNDAASAPFSIDVPAPSSTPGHPSSSGGGGATASSTPGFIAPNPSGPIIATGPVSFHKPSPPPGPVSLKLDSNATQAGPGNSVDFTVTLMAFGKPVSGAPVDLLLVIEPGSDATIDPAHAVTDAKGQVRGVIHLSKTPGDHIVLARSGIYSDEIRVVGRSATNAVATGNSGSGGSSPASATPPLLAVRSPVLWALLTCLLLFGVGFGLNLATAPAGAAGGSGSGAIAGRGGRLGALRGGMALAGEAARFVAAVVVIAGAQALGAVRGRR